MDGVLGVGVTPQGSGLSGGHVVGRMIPPTPTKMSAFSPELVKRRFCGRGESGS